MSDISIIEFIAFSFLSYSSILMLIISTIKDVPVGKALSLIRVIYLVPGVISSAILASSGPHINFVAQSASHFTTTFNVTANKLITNSTTTDTVTNQLTLSSPVWQMFHLLIMLVLLTYVIQQILIFFTAKD